MSVNVTFWKSTSHQTGYKNYSSVHSEPDLRQVNWRYGEKDSNMRNTISEIDTNAETWVQVYSKPNYSGRTALVKPNQSLKMKDLMDDNNSRDMDNSIESFRIYDHNPNEIDKDCTVTFWKDKNKKSYSKQYNGAQEEPNLEKVDWTNDPGHDLGNDISSLKTGVNAWLKVYSKTNYSGREVLIGPNQELNLKDLRDNDNIDDMDNTINSFRLYNKQPIDNTSCKVTFWKDKDSSGHYKKYDNPQNVPDLNKVQWHGKKHDDMKDDITSIDTNPKAWVRIYSKAEYGGRNTLIGPNQSINLRDIKDDKNKDDMDDTIDSFQLFDHHPDINPNKIIDNFVALYPESHRSRKNDLYNIEFYAQDSQYRIYDPTISVSGDTLFFKIKLDHIQLESDDHATVTFSMNHEGDFVNSIQVSYDMATATQLPPWLIKLIDGAISVTDIAAKAIFDGTEIVLTDGVGVVATVETNKIIDYTAKTVTFCVDHLNTVLSAAFTYQDDGGSSNFPAVVSHSIARLVNACYQELFNNKPRSALSFNDSAFRHQLGAGSWNRSKNTPYVNLEQGSYRSYYPDYSFCYGGIGAVSSVKIDAINTAQKDDHLILQAIYDPSGHLFSVAASIDIFDRKKSDDYTSPASGVLTYNSQGEIIHITQGENRTVNTLKNYRSLQSAYADMMTQALNNNAKQYDIRINNKQKKLVDISLNVLNAMTAATDN